MHGFAQQPAGLAFERQVALDDFLRVLANVQLAEFLQVGQAFHKKNALDQAIGVFHLVDGFAVFVLVQLLQAPVFVHPRVQEILVDGGEFVLERPVEVEQNLIVALYGYCSVRRYVTG